MPSSTTIICSVKDVVDETPECVKELMDGNTFQGSDGEVLLHFPPEIGSFLPPHRAKGRQLPPSLPPSQEVEEWIRTSGNTHLMGVEWGGGGLNLDIIGEIY